MNPYSFNSDDHPQPDRARSPLSRSAQYVSNAFFQSAAVLSGLLVPIVLITWIIEGWSGTLEFARTQLDKDDVVVIILTALIFQTGSLFVRYKSPADSWSCGFLANLFVIPIFLAADALLSVFQLGFEALPKDIAPPALGGVSLLVQYLILRNRSRRRSNSRAEELTKTSGSQRLEP